MQENLNEVLEPYLADDHQVDIEKNRLPSSSVVLQSEAALRKVSQSELMKVHPLNESSLAHIKRNNDEDLQSTRRGVQSEDNKIMEGSVHHHHNHEGHFDEDI